MLEFIQDPLAFSKCLVWREHSSCHCQYGNDKPRLCSQMGLIAQSEESGAHLQVGWLGWPVAPALSKRLTFLQPLCASSSYYLCCSGVQRCIHMSKCWSVASKVGAEQGLRAHSETKETVTADGNLFMEPPGWADCPPCP